MLVYQNISHLTGSAEFVECSAEKARGGGLQVRNSLHMLEGKMWFLLCTSGRLGGRHQMRGRTGAAV